MTVTASRLCVAPTPAHPTDQLGLALSTTPEAASLFVEGLDRILAMEAGGIDLMRRALAADPSFGLGHAVVATALAERNAPPAEVWSHINAARASRSGRTQREAGFVTAAALWCNRRLPGEGAMVRHVERWPLDVYAVSLITPSISTSGVDDGVVEIWELLDRLVPVYPSDHWWLTGIRAFARTEQMRLEEAEHLARAGLAAHPASGHAAHALAHVHYETGRRAESVQWIDQWLAGSGSTQEFKCHFAWHAGLCELRLGDRGAAAARFRSDLLGLCGPRALIDAGSLLVRARLAGLPLAGAEAAERVDRAAGPEAVTPSTPFAAWNSALLAWLREDGSRIRQIERQAGHQGGSAWAQIGRFCRGLTSLLDGDTRGADLALRALGDTAPMGGSPAQRELISDLADLCLAA